MPDTTNQELEVQFARLEERMNTRKAEYDSALDRFRGDMETFRADMARRDKENTRWIIALVAVAVIVTIGVSGYLQTVIP